MKSYSKSVILTLLILIGFSNFTMACSVYKVTKHGVTVVGCNEDAWRTTSCIWFENKVPENSLGAAFTGSRKVSETKFAPHSGMNEAGLVFSRLTAYHPKENSLGKKQITDEVHYLSDILHSCKTVNEVKKYVDQYDRSPFISDVFIYIDSTGNYLIVEPYASTLGNDSAYVLANFCPSLTSNSSARKQARFRNGQDYLLNHEIDTNLAFCTALSDTMHVCRNRNGDGTLLTSIWNTKAGLVNLYFYHNYDSTIQFDLSHELAKGDHRINLPERFPENKEFKRLATYKTPFNVTALRVALVFTGAGFLFLSLLFLLSYFKNRNSENHNRAKLLFAGTNLVLLVYLYILATHINIYYFEAPYQHYSSNIISLFSFTPFLLLILLVPCISLAKLYFKQNRGKSFIKSLLALNTLMYLVLIAAFVYWGLFEVIN